MDEDDLYSRGGRRRGAPVGKSLSRRYNDYDDPSRADDDEIYRRRLMRQVRMQLNDALRVQIVT